MISFAKLQSLTGRGVRVALVDSGVSLAHPHVGEVAGGVHIKNEGQDDLYTDDLGHGTAVAGAVREKAPEASIYAVKVFDGTLATNISRLAQAIEWCIARRIHIINLSLGTSNPAYRERFEELTARAAKCGSIVVAPREINGQASFPGCLPSVVGVDLDWLCKRDTFRYALTNLRPTFYASGYPRPVPGVPNLHNLNGISFAVANMTGFAARLKQACADDSLTTLESALIQYAQNCELTLRKLD